MPLSPYPVLNRPCVDHSPLVDCVLVRLSLNSSRILCSIAKQPITDSPFGQACFYYRFLAIVRLLWPFVRLPLVFLPTLPASSEDFQLCHLFHRWPPDCRSCQFNLLCLPDLLQFASLSLFSHSRRPLTMLSRRVVLAARTARLCRAQQPLRLAQLPLMFQHVRTYADVTIKVPQMAESISEGTLSQIAKVGQQVEQDEEIATIETDKVCSPGYNSPFPLSLFHWPMADGST